MYAGNTMESRQQTSDMCKDLFLIYFWKIKETTWPELKNKHVLQ